ncbi:DUF975 family protein [Bacillus sp. XF8]|uniref:DUF975 family protein n=1 Tax=Bacillus sp. XF8 TaxID=2819289 RepID=UPI001AA0243B|nr:DUF975 family protein [Bacillus sp. XF8]MBO1580567.1 DUF975 family protein [Bacillus sp. XF8]
MISDLKNAALSSLKGRWGLGVGTTFLHYVIPAIGMYIIGLLVFVMFGLSLDLIEPEADTTSTFFAELSLFIFCAIIFFIYIAVQSVISYGYYNFTLRLAKKESTTIGNLFEGFKKNNLFRSIKLGILQAILIFLWSLLFIIPGIIKFFSYSMAFYILLENPEYTASEAIKKSKEMMKGHKLDLFILWLSFIGWFILGSFLGMFTLNLPYLWISPYYNTTVSHFYLNLVNRNNTVEEKTVI